MMSTKLRNREIRVADDGLYTPDVGSWGENKHRLFWYYADLFATSMKGKWHQRVYLDLFAGAGRARIQDTDRIVLGSPLLALEITHPFDRYIFCDKNPECIEALRMRVPTAHPAAEAIYLVGDVNQLTEEILNSMPPYGPSRRVLGFCFVDPYRLQDLRFPTISALAARYMDFLILVPAMDPLRNQANYLDRSNNVLDSFLGTTAWRTAWANTGGRIPFDLFVANLFNEQMRQIEYKFGGIHESVLVRSTEKNLRLYRLGFFSRSKLGEHFWKEAKRYSDPQLHLL
jgi:three-Cys-motif partner protein